MAWTELTRTQHKRKSTRYPSDLTSEEWAVAGSLLPGPSRLGRPREVDLRQVRDAIQSIAAAGCAWSLLPRNFPPVSTVRYYFYRWRDDGLLAEINRALVAHPEIMPPSNLLQLRDTTPALAGKRCRLPANQAFHP